VKSIDFLIYFFSNKSKTKNIIRKILHSFLNRPVSMHLILLVPDCLLFVTIILPDKKKTARFIFYPLDN